MTVVYERQTNGKHRMPRTLVPHKSHRRANQHCQSLLPFQCHDQFMKHKHCLHRVQAVPIGSPRDRNVSPWHMLYALHVRARDDSHPRKAQKDVCHCKATALHKIQVMAMLRIGGGCWALLRSESWPPFCYLLPYARY